MADTGPFGTRILSDSEVLQLRNSSDFVTKSVTEDIARIDRLPRTLIPQLKRQISRPKKIAEPPISFELLYEIAERSYIVRMVVNAIVRECTRKTVKGLRRFWDFFPQFEYKCIECGREFQEEVEECQCGSKAFREPDPDQLKPVMALLQSPNPTHSFGDIIKKCLYDAQVIDDWFISITYDYTQSRPVSLWYESPINIMIAADDFGMLGNDEYFCPIHTRRNPEKYYQKEKETCPECGQKLHQTAYYQVIDGEITARFAKHEMIHGNSYSVGTRLYGNSPLRSLITAVMTAMAIDNYGFDAFTLQREPNSALLYHGVSQSEVDRIAEEWRTKRMENPHGQLWIGTQEGQALEYIKMLDTISNAETIAEREYFRSVVCSVYGVSPIYVAVETPGRLGNANDYQIHVQNNTTESNQDQISEQINRDLLPLFKITDWFWDFTPVEPEDEKLEAEILGLYTTAAKTAREAGLDVFWDENGPHITGEATGPPPAPAPMALASLKTLPTLTEKTLTPRPEGTVYGERTIEDAFNETLQREYRAAISRAIKSFGDNMTKEQFLAIVGKELGNLTGNLGTKARAYVEEVYRKGLDQAARDLNIKIEFGGTDISAIDYLANEWHGITTTLPDFTNDQRRMFSDIIEDAYTDEAGFNLRDMTKRMQEVSDAERYKLERIARSETTQISNHARANGYKRDPDYAKRKYHWSDANDSCDECRRIAAGGPYTMAELEKITNGLRVHPNCRCTPILHVEGA